MRWQALQLVNSGENAIWSFCVWRKVLTTKSASDPAEGRDSPSQMWESEPASISGWKSPSRFTRSIGLIGACTLR